MNTPKQPETPLGIKATYIGPIMTLDGVLSGRGQNLLFATSGTGKSFISRALRVLGASSAEEGGKIDPADIVSEESESGEIVLLEGNAEIAKVVFNKTTGAISRSANDYIFHVFSSDYVSAELASKAYVLDGNIDHEIILGKENRELQDKEAEHESAVEKRRTAQDELNKSFEAGKTALQKRLEIRANLQPFKDLSLAKCMALGGRPSDLKSSAEIKAQFDALKAIPSDPKKPQLPPVPTVDLDFVGIRNLLQTSVDRSTVAAEVKSRIEKDREFFESGIRHYHENSEACPFCTQAIGHTAKAAIDAYLAYFADAEAKTHRAIRTFKERIAAMKRSVSAYEASVNQAIIDYDALKVIFPSLASENLESVAELCSALTKVATAIEVCIDEKATDLSQPMALDEGLSFDQVLTSLGKLAARNQKKVGQLNSIVENSTNERLVLQRSGCTAFEYDFSTDHKVEIAELISLDAQVAQLAGEVESLRKSSGDKIKAREKVADTLEELINFVFAGRYTFHRDKFTVQRDKKEMVRGSDRTLSDGEKTILAFCYFIAQAHLKVAEVNDYQKLFFIVDDPVSSVSFDYVYCICQILKTLRIVGADLKINTDGSTRPKLLILTHHDFFYNVVLNNNVIKKEALFQLVSRITKHEILSQKDFVAPHRFHLEHIRGVATSNAKANPSTPNAIRSVLEGVWRFSYPNLPSLESFIGQISGECNVQVRSVLIQDMSHGGKMWAESPLSADIETACKEAIEIVRHCAPGQVADVPVFADVQARPLGTEAAA